DAGDLREIRRRDLRDRPVWRPHQLLACICPLLAEGALEPDLGGGLADGRFHAAQAGSTRPVCRHTRGQQAGLSSRCARTGLGSGRLLGWQALGGTRNAPAGGAVAMTLPLPIPPPARPNAGVRTPLFLLGVGMALLAFIAMFAFGIIFAIRGSRWRAVAGCFATWSAS